MNINEQQYLALLGVTFNLISLAQQSGDEISIDNIDTFIKNATQATNLTIDQDTYNELFSDIEYQFCIQHSEGSIIYNDYDDPHDWYIKEDVENDYYWRKYKYYLLNHTSIDKSSITLLDDETLPRIINCLINPNEKFEGKKLKRGLIIGDVQSGKTSTYTGLICKAADAGYKVVILLAGTTENLRNQTQVRIDEGIVGLTTIQVGRETKQVRVGVGKDNKPIMATSYTSSLSDFVAGSNKISTSLKSHNSLVLFVIKKNVTILTKLLNWLTQNNLDPIKGYIDNPMILIDDEADNASINTKKDELDPTKTNKLIREICNLFKASNYIGFTATPFANVFINPESIDRMNNEDLFPKDFIYTLPTPSSYIGSEKIFSVNGSCKRAVIPIIDIDESEAPSDNDSAEANAGPFFYKHSKYWHGTFPDSLKESIYCFYLANVVRDLRGDKKSPRSMLINMSRFVRVQKYISEYVEDINKRFFDTVRFDFSDTPSKNKRLPLYQKLEYLWKKYFNNITDISFKRVINKKHLMDATEKIKVVVVNGSRTSGKLNYKEDPYLRVIAVGGLALSRGLTLEGLLVSYFYRNTSTFDVLMQMGRWFGYRRNYDDLFEIWTSSTSADWYAEISAATEELKDDLKEMFEQRLTPKDFGIKVRDYSDELRITASNKMRTASSYLEQYSFYGNVVDTPYVSLNTEFNKRNLNLINLFVQELIANGKKLKFSNRVRYNDKDVESYDIGASRYFEDVDKRDIIRFLRSIKCSKMNMMFNVEQILDFVEDENNVNIDKWNVVFDSGKSEQHYDIDGLRQIKCPDRTIVSNGNVIQITSRRRLLSMGVGKYTLSSEQITLAEQRRRDEWKKNNEDFESRSIPLKAYFEFLSERNPVLYILLVNPLPPVCEEEPIMAKFRSDLGSDRIATFGIGFPSHPSGNNDSRIKWYKVNKIFMSKAMEDLEEIEEDDDNEE